MMDYLLPHEHLDKEMRFITRGEVVLPEKLPDEVKQDLVRPENYISTGTPDHLPPDEGHVGVVLKEQPDYIHFYDLTGYLKRLDWEL